MLGDPGLEAVGRASARERATRLEVGDDHDAVRVQDFGGLSHEVHPGEADDVPGRFCRRLCELKRVADEVGDVLNLALLIVVGEKDRVAFLLEALDLAFDIAGADGCCDHGSLPAQPLVLPRILDATRPPSLSDISFSTKSSRSVLSESSSKRKRMPIPAARCSVAWLSVTVHITSP